MINTLYIFNIILKCKEDNKKYFRMYDVRSCSEVCALNLIKERAQKIGFSIVSIEEINCVSEVKKKGCNKTKIIQTYGKIFYEEE